MKISLTDGPLLGVDFPLPLDRPFTSTQAAAAGITRTVLAAQTPDSPAPAHGRAVARRTRRSRRHGLDRRLALTGLLPPNDHLRVPPVSLFRPAGRGRLRNELCDSGERAFRPEDLMTVGGLRVTTPLRTAWDIGRLAHRDRAISALDGLLRHGHFTREELIADVERFRKQRGVVQLRQLAPLADGRAESPGESVLRLRWLDLPSLPRPEPQVPSIGERGVTIYRLDLGVEELRFSVEYDGEEFHTRPEDRDRDDVRRAWIRRHRGWLIEPVRRHDIFGSTRDVERILYDGVDRARRRLGEFRPSP